jgi:hypothetical protein
MQSKLEVRNRGYAAALAQIGEILKQVEAAKKKEADKHGKGNNDPRR